MNNDNTLSSWIDPLTCEQIGNLLVTPSSEQKSELTPDEWWAKLNQTSETINTVQPTPPAVKAPPATSDTTAAVGPQGVVSPITQRPESLPRTAISAIRQKLDSMGPKPSTHQQSPKPSQTEQKKAQTTTVSIQSPLPETETPSARPPFTPALGKLQLPKPQPKTATTPSTPSAPQTTTTPAATNRPTKITSQTERALDRYNDWATEYLSFSNICLLDEFGDIVAGHRFDSTFTAAASTLGNAFLNATQFQQEIERPEDVHHFPHRAAHTPWEDKHMTVIPVKTPRGLLIVAGLANEAVDRRKACMAAETLLRVTAAPKN